LTAILDPDGVPTEWGRFGFVPERNGTYRFIAKSGEFGLDDPIDRYVTTPLTFGGSIIRTYIPGQGVFFSFTPAKKSLVYTNFVSRRASEKGVFLQDGRNVYGVLQPGVTYLLLVSGDDEDRFTARLEEIKPPRKAKRLKPTKPKKR
jgi:hypothetical protein